MEQAQQNNNLSHITPQTPTPSPPSPAQIPTSQFTSAAVWDRGSYHQADRCRNKARIIAWADIVSNFSYLLIFYTLNFPYISDFPNFVINFLQK